MPKAPAAVIVKDRGRHLRSPQRYTRGARAESGREYFPLSPGCTPERLKLPRASGYIARRLLAPRG
jgi:hypothetical protein